MFRGRSDRRRKKNLSGDRTDPEGDRLSSTPHTEPVATVLDGLLEAEREDDEHALAETGVTDPKSAWAEPDARAWFRGS